MAEESKLDVKRPRGRPKKTSDPPMEQKRPRGRPKKPPVKKVPKKHYDNITELMKDYGLSELPPLYKCTRCGLLTSSPLGRFYQVVSYGGFGGNDHFSNICIDCTKKYYDEFLARYKDENLALLLTCSITGFYFSQYLYEQLIAKGDVFNIGNYFRSLNMAQYKNKNFSTFLLELKDGKKMISSIAESREYHEAKWRAADNRNKFYCVRTLGYDCFDDEMYTVDERKFLYNTLSAYLTDEVVEDPHKLNAAITIVKNILQVDKITRIINQMLTCTQPDSNAIQKMIGTKTSLQSTINATAKANGISMEGGGRKPGSGSSLTGIMKDMLNDGFDEAKVNVTSSLLDEAYQKVAQQSARALMAELNFTGDEYARMVSEQSERARLQEAKILELEEENRLLRVKVYDFEHKEKHKDAKPIEFVDGAEYIEGEEFGDVT